MDRAETDPRPIVSKRRFFEHVQVLRAIAAVQVLLVHSMGVLGQFPSDAHSCWFARVVTGRFGVNLFFIISGFILSQVVTASGFGLKSFAIKRGLRLYPLYMLCTVIMALVTLLSLQGASRPHADYDFTYLLKSLTLFPQERLPLLTPGWTLERELIFYVIIGLGVAFFSYRAVLATLAVLAAVGVTWHLILPLLGVKVWFDYHIFSFIHAYFLIGCLLWVFRDKWMKCANAWWLVAGVVIPLVVNQVLNGCELNWSGYVRATFSVRTYLAELCLLDGGGALLFVGLYYAIDKRRHGPRAAKVIAAASNFGAMSYSIYLVHYIWIPVFLFVHREYFMTGPLAFADWFAPIYALLFVAVSCLSGWAFYHVMEKPLTAATARLAKRRATSGVSAESAV